MQKLQLSIPEPCHQDWNEMTPNQQGRFCGSCAKTVIDFSAMTDAQLIFYFENLKQENVCGRVYPDQLDRQIEQPVPMQPRKKMYWLWQYAAAMLLFFTKGIQAKAQGEIRTKASTDTNKVRINPDIPIRLGGIRRVDLPENVHVLPAPVSQLFITDENNNPIAGASVQLFPQEKLMITDSAGRINLGKNHAYMQVTISAVGYTSKKVLLKNIEGNSVRLVREIQLLENVVVASDVSIRGKMSMMLGGMTVSRIITEENEVPLLQTAENKEPVFSIYPNPVQKGKQLSFTMTAADNKTYKVFISDVNGKTIMQQSIAATNKAQQQKLNLPASCSSGMYVMSMTDNKGEIVQSEKIIFH